MLTSRHSDIQFVGEEGAQSLPPGGRFWLVDPLCGTANYAADLPLFATNVALVEDGLVTAAVVADVMRREIYVAERGRGAWRSDGQRLQASAVSQLVSVDPFLGSNSHPLGEFSRRFAVRAITQARFGVRIFASTLVLAYVATGRLAAAVFCNTPVPVHVAAGLLLAEEAGAIVTDDVGAPWRLTSPLVVIAASRELHQELLRSARETLNESGQQA
ncbi:MAG: inositol monophosphatase family protein, partial [Chloroflexi bacterium]|nr:inositol monophosphatase family protein [Chloroflexota bacterium]